MSETTIKYETNNDAMRPRLLTSVMTINYHSGLDATRPRLTLFREDDKLLTSSPQHVRNDLGLPTLL